MKSFLTNFVIFSLCFLGLILAGILFVNIQIRNKASFKLPKSSKYVIAGHSHPECAFNDSLIAGFSNLSQSGESYFYTNIKLRKILEQNKSINSVFIEFTNNQVGKEMDEWIWGEKYIMYRFPTYSPFMSINDKWLLLKKNASTYLNVQSVSLKSNLLRIAKNNYQLIDVNIGGYSYLVMDKIDSLILYQKNKPVLKEQLAVHNLEYLDKIITYCKSQGIGIYLIRSPLHAKYDGYNNEAALQNLLSSKYSNIEFLDFSKFPLANSEFGDLEHLNYRGARKFSIWFNDLIEKGLLNQTKKQVFINQKIDDFKHEHI